MTRYLPLLFGQTLLAGALLLAGLAGTFHSATAEDAPACSILLAAAASLEQVFEREIIPGFRERHPEIEVAGTYDASGKLQTQIENGLAADVFMSAAMKQMDALVAKKIVSAENVKPVLENRLVLICPAGAGRVTGEQADSFASVARAATGIIALGDPQSVPAGQYAREVFTRLDVWDAVAARASFATNVTEVLAWVAEASADLGVVYATDAALAAGKVRVLAAAPDELLPEKIIYPAARLAASANPEEAELFLDFLASNAARSAFREYGFSVIGRDD